MAASFRRSAGRAWRGSRRWRAPAPPTPPARPPPALARGPGRRRARWPAARGPGRMRRPAPALASASFWASRCSSVASARSSRRAASSTAPSPASAVMTSPPHASWALYKARREAEGSALEAACLTRLGGRMRGRPEPSDLRSQMSVPPLTMANAIRALSMDAVHRAKSGHQGMPLGMADVATVLWTKVLKYDAADPALARPRPLRALGRPRLDAALQPAAPDRLRRP